MSFGMCGMCGKCQTIIRTLMANQRRAAPTRHCTATRDDCLPAAAAGLQCTLARPTVARAWRRRRLNWQVSTASPVGKQFCILCFGCWRSLQVICSEQPQPIFWQQKDEEVLEDEGMTQCCYDQKTNQEDEKSLSRPSSTRAAAPLLEFINLRSFQPIFWQQKDEEVLEDEGMTQCCFDQKKNQEDEKSLSRPSSTRAAAPLSEFINLRSFSNKTIFISSFVSFISSIFDTFSMQLQTIWS